VHAVLKDSATYEHIKPELVGNRQRVLLSDLSGRSNILYKLQQHGLGAHLDEAAHRQLLERIKHMEYQGYELEAAEGTFELLVREALHPGVQLFEVVSYEVTMRNTDPRKPIPWPPSHSSPGRRPLRNSQWPRPHERPRPLSPPVPLQALPGIANVQLTDYKVRVLDTKKGTAAKVRVLVEWTDHKRSWATVGVSDNVITASWSPCKTRSNSNSCASSKAMKL